MPGQSIHMDQTPMIYFSGVSKAYDGAWVLKQVDLTVYKGEKIALMGYSGCGKTTLLRCINGLEQCSTGQLIVNGANLSNPDLDWNRFRAGIGMVFQQFNLFPHLTVLENLMLAPTWVRRMPKAEAEKTAMCVRKAVI